MKMVKSLLLGSAAGLVAFSGAQAADLPVKAKPAQYVKICSLYGAGFYYIPGTDTCIKVGGYMRAEWNYQAANSFKPRISFNFDDPNRDRYNERTRGGVTLDVRSQTAYGTLRGYAVVMPTFNEDSGHGGSPYTPSQYVGDDRFTSAGVFAPAIFIQFAGFTFGKTASFFDFDTNPYTQATIWTGSNQAGNGQQVFAYTAQFGNGFSATLSAEDPTTRRTSILNSAGVAPSNGNGTGGFGYGGRRWPDVVANLRIDQAWGSAQVMGAIHDVYENDAPTGNTNSETGYAIGAGLRINLPMIGKGDYIIGQVTFARGAANYTMNQGATGGAVANLAEGAPFTGVTNRAYGYLTDAATTGGGTGLDLTKSWSVTGGFDHIWNPMWKTSIYGNYLNVDYGATASAAIAAIVGGGAAGSADWSMWQVGSRTTWTPVQNLDLSVDVIYSHVDGGFSGSPGPVDFGNKGIVSALFRAQRNFWP